MESTIPTAVGRLQVRVEGDDPSAVLWHSLYVDDRSWDRPNGEAVIAGGGHLTPLESPDETIDIVQRLWGRA